MNSQQKRETHKVCSRCNAPLSIPGKRWEFTLHLEPPSQNVVSGNKGGGRFKYKDFRDFYRLLLKNQIQSLQIPPAKTKRRVLITRLYSGRGRKRDHGNIVGGCKPLLDALTLEGLLVDDSEKFVEDHYYQERGKDQGVRIVIDEEF